MDVKINETVKVIELDPALKRDAIEALFLEKYIEKTITTIVKEGARVAMEASEVWRRLGDAAQADMGDKWVDDYQLSFDHREKHLIVYKKIL